MTVTPARARYVRALIEAERADALRAGEPTPAPAAVPTITTPAEVLAAQRQARGCCVCGTTPAGLYLAGRLCAAHEPRPAPTPDPELTAAALQRARARSGWRA